MDDTIELEFDKRTDEYQVHCESDGPMKVTTTVVFAICSVSGEEPRQIPSLSEAIDPDVLTLHVEGPSRGARVSFDYRGYRVDVRDDGLITLAPLDEREEEAKER